MTQTSIARRIAWWSLLAMVFLVPIVMSDFALPGMQGHLAFSSVEMVKLSLLMILTLIGLGAWAIDLLRKGGHIRHSSVSWLVLAWLIWVGVTTFTSVHWPTALLGTQGRYEGLITFVTYAAVYFLALQFVDEKGRVLRLAIVLICSSAVVSIYGLLTYAGVGAVAEYFSNQAVFRVPNVRVFSSLGHPNVLAGFLIFSLTISLALALQERRTLLRLAYWGSAGLSSLTLLLTFSRGAWIAGSMAILLLAIITWRQRVKLRRVDLAPIALFIAAFVGLAARSLSSASKVTDFAERLASIFAPSEDSSASARIEIWRAAVRAVKDRPLLGWGPDTFGMVSPRYETLEYQRLAGSMVADNAHNHYLQLAAGVGILGAAMFIALWVWALLKSSKTVFARDGGAGLLTGSFWAAAIGYLVHLVFNISVPGTTFLLWIALAVILAPSSRSVIVRPRRFGATIAVGIALLAILGIAGQSVALAADRDYVIAAEDMSQSSLDQRVVAAKRAVSLNPLVPTYRSALAALSAERMRADAAALEQAQRDGEDTGAYAEALAQSFAQAESDYQDAIASTPNDLANYVNLAAIYNLAGASLDPDYYQRAVETVNRGLEVRPLSVELRQRLADTYVATGRAEQAIEVLEYCLQLRPSQQSALTLAKVYQEAGMSEEALSVLRSFRERYAADARVPRLDAAIRALEAGQALPD